MLKGLHCQLLYMQTPSFLQATKCTINKSDWVALGQNESPNDVNLFVKYYNLFLLIFFYFRAVLDIQKKCKDSSEFLYTRYPIFTIITILCLNGTFVKINEPVLIHYY